MRSVKSVKMSFLANYQVVGDKYLKNIFDHFDIDQTGHLFEADVLNMNDINLNGKAVIISFTKFLMEHPGNYGLLRYKRYILEVVIQAENSKIDDIHILEVFPTKLLKRSIRENINGFLYGLASKTVKVISLGNLEEDEYYHESGFLNFQGLNIMFCVLKQTLCLTSVPVLDIPSKFKTSRVSSTRSGASGGKIRGGFRSKKWYKSRQGNFNTLAVQVLLNLTNRRYWDVDNV